MDNSIVRGTLLLGAGVCIGVIIGLAISPTPHPNSGVAQGVAGSPANVTIAKAKPGSHLEAEMEHPNILLGDIVTVPFQEFYGVFSTFLPQPLNNLATQL